MNITITTLDIGLARMLEPRAPRPELRLENRAGDCGGGDSRGGFPNPIMPLITDQQERLDRLAKPPRSRRQIFRRRGALSHALLAESIFSVSRKNFPHLLRRYQERYERDAYLKGPWREMVRERIAVIRDRYGLRANPPSREIPAWEDPQGFLI